MKAAIRINALSLKGSGHKTLEVMERHGKRLDETSQKRQVRTVGPLVHGTLNLRAAYTLHVKGCVFNAQLKKPALHALIQFPTNIKITPENEVVMLKWSVAFINETHGGDAVFAARLDRDEKGQHNVDVFFAPKYVKITKNRKNKPVHTTWMSTTKFGKDLCKKHCVEIMSRNEKGKFSTTPRSNGIALQTELLNYMMKRGIKLEPRKIKKTYGNDRLEVEAFKRVKEAEAQIERDLKELEIRSARVRRDFLKLNAFADQMMNCGEALCDMLSIKPPSKLLAMLEYLEEQKSWLKLDSADEPDDDAPSR